MHEDFDDTVLIPSRRSEQPDGGVDEDTVVPHTREQSDDPGYDSEPALRSAVVAAPALATTGGRSPSAEPGERHPPALVEPPPSRQRRVPLTHKRLQETLRSPAAAHGPVLPAGPKPPSVTASRSAAAPVAPPLVPAPAATPPAPALVYGFRMAGKAAVDLEVPALIGRKPTAPRVTAKTFPRLVRVPSPLNEVSSTHIELRQEGTSVIVTDLRSTNGTVVRMPGSRPVKLRQGESLVVRPGTLIDIGDGNVFEILSPPRLGVQGDSAGDGMWS